MQRQIAAMIRNPTDYWQMWSPLSQEKKQQIRGGKGRERKRFLFFVFSICLFAIYKGTVQARWGKQWCNPTVCLCLPLSAFAFVLRYRKSGGVLVSVITVISVQDSSLTRIRRKYGKNTLLIAENNVGEDKCGEKWNRCQASNRCQTRENVQPIPSAGKSRRAKLLFSSADWFCMIAVFGRKHTLHAKPKPQQIKPLTMIIFAFSVLCAHERWSAPDSRGDYRGSLASSWWTRLPALWRRI